MRTSLLASAALAFALVLAAPPAAAPASTCGETSCGIPSCWNASVRTRPDIAREVTISCSSVESAKVTSQPAHGTVENASVGFYTLSFTVRADADSPRYDEATFELTGRDGSIEQKVQIEVIPNSENSPPVCDGDHVTQRSDGSAPVDVYLHPYCRDPDGDDFVIEGGPPGVHPDSPKHVPAGESESNWRYRTATSSGDESTTIWATDSLGARSADARLDVTVGPGIDRLPTCAPSSWSNATSYYPVYSRPGAIRRFGIICTDPDADPFTASLSSPPHDGALATFAVGMPASGYWGAERWIDATYVPTSDSTDPDPFSVTASGSSGAGPEAHLAIVPRPPSQNGGGGCGYGPASVVADLPGVVSLSCEDDDGDPLSVEVLSQPDHGVAAPGLVTPGRYGWQDITVPYVPTPGYVGEDCVKIRVADGHGLTFDLALDIDVTPAPPPVDTQPPPVDVGPPPVPPVPPVPATPPDLPPLPDLPGPPGPPGPPDPPAPPTSPTPPLKSAVEEALGTTAVKRVRSYKGAQVWARSRLSRADLTRYGQASGLVVVCSKRCQIRSAAALASGRRSVRSSEVRTVSAALAGQPHVVSLAISPAERRALRLRPTRRARARFTLSVRPSGGPARTLRSSIPVSR